MSLSRELIFSLLIVSTASLNTIAQLLMKLGTGFSLINPYLIGGIGLYGFSTLLYIAVLGKFNLSIAYPVVIGLTVVLTTVAGAVLLRERVSLTGWVGVSLLLGGIFAIASTSRVP